MIAKKQNKRLLEKIKLIPYFFVFFATLSIVYYGSRNKQVDETDNNLNLQSITKKDYAVSADQLSEFYMVSELANNLSLASSVDRKSVV